MGLSIPDIESSKIDMGSTAWAALAGDAPASYAAGTSRIVALPRLMPAQAIGLSLSGTYTAAGGAGPTRDGAVGLIASVQLLVNQQIVAELTGWQLAKLTRIWTGRAPYSTGDVIVGATSAAFEVEVIMPQDVGSYLSLLDLPMASAASLRITWGTPADIAVDAVTPGAEAVSADTQCAVMVYGPTGFLPGVFGGAGANYWRHYRQVTSIPIAASGQVAHWLAAGRYYDSITIMQLDGSGNYVSTLVTNVTVKRGSTEQLSLTPGQIRAQMTEANQLDASMENMLDVIHVDFVRGAHKSSLIVSAQNHLNQVILDVTGTGTVYVVEDWFTLLVPTAAKK